LADDPQKNVDFYAGILGLRLIKKTINFDAPEVYHLYYGDESGTPGTILTFFPYTGIPRGRQGKGQMTTTAFSIPENSLGYWMERLTRFNIPFTQPQERFEEAFIYLEDFDGMGIELVATAKDNRIGFTYGNVEEEYCIKGFHSVTLSEDGYERTAGLLVEGMNHKLVAERGNRFRYSAGKNEGGWVDVVCEPERLRGLQGAGSVHHVAFSTDNDNTLQEIQQKLQQYRVQPTHVIDRQYFHSIYFREPGGILFEVATNPPGFEVDEDKSTLGEKLQLPPWQEPHRKTIESKLAPIVFDWKAFK
jgi:glyoxalase family protein